MIKAVAQAIPTYQMNIFNFLAVVCNEMDALISDLWWGQIGEERKIHWVVKDTLGLPKQNWGMGFRNFQAFNDSLWARVLKARYFPHCSFFDA